jgi:FkbM family methyltransferase
MKAILKSLFEILGFEIHRKKQPVLHSYFRNEQMVQGFKHIQNLDLKFNTVIDVGAADGSWALSAKEFWPFCDFLLLEPLIERKEELEQLAGKYPNFQYIPFAAGAEKSVIQFYVADDLDGSGIADELGNNKNIRNVETTSIDSEILNKNLKGPYLVKLDTHGFEVPILKGCEKILDQVSAFIIECYGFHITKDSLLFWEMCQYMDNIGYRLFNIIDVTNRPKDLAFWQCDAVFIDKRHAIFNANTFN